MNYHIFPLRTLSPLHAGIGQGLNDIDLPTARNSVTGHPIIPGSSIKGVIKQEFKQENYGVAIDGFSTQQITDTLFGAEQAEFASAISIGDANLLALPVRSYYGTFGYLASPYSLLNLKKQLQQAGWKDLPKVPTLGLNNQQEYTVLITQNSVLSITDNPIILLEELDLSIDPNQTELAQKWATLIAKLFFKDEEGKDIFIKRFAITDDNALNFFCETALPVDARIAIDSETGAVKAGALWYEETVPPETLFIGFAAVNRSFNKDVKLDKNQLSSYLQKTGDITCQMGGKSTTGKGFVTLSFIQKEQ